MDDFAPVVIPTLNRHMHFKRCIESLAACHHADRTELYIFLDYPLKDDHWEGYNIINNYLSTIIGFKAVNIIKRKNNYGPYRNSTKAVEHVFKKFDRLIFSEDDNIFAQDFLRFVNRGLAIYQNRADIFSISGYQYPVFIPKIYNEDIYLWQGFSAWGVGFWKYKWEKVYSEKTNSTAIVRDFLKNYYSVYRFQKIANHYLPSLLYMLKRQMVIGDSYINLYLFKNNMYSVFPLFSRVRNLGHDGSGVHSVYKVDDIFTKNNVLSSI
jgi:hypothetical protein